MASESFKASIVDQIADVRLHHNKWFGKVPSEEEAAERVRVLRFVMNFLQSGNGARRGYEDCVSKLKKIHSAFKALHNEVRDTLRNASSDERLLDQFDFDKEYEARMKQLNHVIEILHLKALLMELQE